MPKSSTTKPRQYKCEFCERQFTDEMRLINHICEKKRRWFQKDQPQGRIAFLGWSRFYELNSRLKKQGEKKTYREFIDSRYYLAFSKFSRHILDLAVPEPTKFIDYVIKNNLPIDNWTHDIVFEQYIKELIRTEPPEQALERAIILMREWGQQHDKPWNDFFREVNTNQIANWVKMGRISPWVLYNADSAADMLTRCTPEQVGIIMTAAPVAQWSLKFKNDKEGANFVKDTLKKAGI